MDTTAIDIEFDRNGICNYCSQFLERAGHIINEDYREKECRLQRFVSGVKAAGDGKPYDCVVGVSGGVDSSWTLVQVKRLGLRPLAVHMDNGWNSELAQNNIENLVRSLDVDLYTHVVNWHEYRSLMQAFFDADVIDVELLYDNAMLAVNYQQAARYGVNYILAGTNKATEGMRMPTHWNWFKHDKRNIKAIASLGGIKKLKSFPAIGTIDFIWYHFCKRINWVSFLDFVPYNKFEVLDELEGSYGYRRYPFKHYESIFTRFYQGFILPRKFGVDKRLVHLGTLVASGQLDRQEALEGLQGIPYPEESDLQSDIAYFLKKMGWSEQQLDDYISRPGKPHNMYGSEKTLWTCFKTIYNCLSR